MIKLYKNPSLVDAKTIEDTVHILISKAEAFENNEAMTLDYIGNTLNILQGKINEYQIQKIEAEQNYKDAKATLEIIKHNIALALIDSFGVDNLSDKTADICSSIKIKSSEDAKVELKERALTQSEMKSLLEANRLPVTKVEEVEIKAKLSIITPYFKKGKKVPEMKPKDAKEYLANKYKELEDENTTTIPDKS